jgi:phage terminase large subunit-like protein
MKLSLGITPRDYSAAGGITYDADALAYFTANTTITSAADKNAINTFYLGLKSDGIYTKMKAMYLPIWGSAASSKWNLKDPRDLDAAFRLTFTTGWTYSSSGITPNGTSAYADTFLIPSTAFANTNTHLSFYSRTLTNTGFADMGAYWTDTPAAAPTLNTAVYILQAGRPSDNNAVGYLSNDDTNRILYSQTNARGHFILSRTATNSLKMYQGGTLKQTNTTVNSTAFNKLPQNKIYISGLNFRDSNGTSILNYGAKQCSFSSIGDSLTDTDATNFYTRVQSLMTYFGINV